MSNGETLPVELEWINKGNNRFNARVDNLSYWIKPVARFYRNNRVDATVNGTFIYMWCPDMETAVQYCNEHYNRYLNGGTKWRKNNDG